MTYPSLRIATDNAADRATITTSPSAVSTLPVANLKTNIKTDVCRINNANPTITLSWSAEEQISCVAIPACNGSSECEYRVRLYNPTSTLVYDSDWQWGAPGPILDNWDFTQTLNVNSFAEGATVIACWLPEPFMAVRVTIELRDPLRTYWDISRIVAGQDFRPRYGASYGSALGVEDMATASRSAAGNLHIERGPTIESLSLDINHIHTADRHRFARILKQGVGRHHFISALPDDPDVTLDQDYSIYGVIQPAPMPFVTYGSHSTQYVIQGW